MERAGPVVERYLPPEDPNVFLISGSRLTGAEQRWQRVFVALPWVLFACMAATPLLLLRANLPWLQDRADAERRAVAGRAVAAHQAPGFVVIGFSQMVDVLDRPLPTLVMLFDPATFASKVFLALMPELDGLLRAGGIPVSVAALDLSAAPGPPPEFLAEYPRPLTPHLQLVLPGAHDGEAGVVDYDGTLSARGLAEAARKLAGPFAPELPEAELDRIEGRLLRLSDAMFELFFIGDVPSGPEPRKAPWWRRVLGAGRGADGAGAPGTALRVEEISNGIELLNGLDVAISSCEALLQSRPARGAASA